MHNHRHPGRCAIASTSLSLFLLAGVARAQCQDEITKIQYPFLNPGAQFGEAVAIDGTVVVIGERLNDMTLNDSGAVHVYERSPQGAFIITATLKAPQPQFQSWFGMAVAIDGDRIVVGAPRHDPQFGQADRGAVFVYQRNAVGNWVLETTLLASNGANTDEFGSAVDISGVYVAVGAPCQPGASTQGKAYVYRFGALGWVEHQIITPSSGQADSKFGAAIAIDSEYLIVGQPGYDLFGQLDVGRAEVFKRTFINGPFFLASLNNATTPAPAERFGQDVDIDAATATALIGAWSSNLQPFRGSVYVITEAPNHWPIQQQLLASNGSDHHHFGWSVSIEGNTALIGAWGNDSAYEFRRSGNQFTETQILTSGTPGLGDSFAYDVAISGDRAALGNPSFTLADQSVHVFGSIGSLGTNYGPLAPNSVGPGAVMAATGSSSIAANNLVLHTSGCLANKPGLYLFGMGEDQGPFYDGYLLVSLPVQRINIAVTTDAAGNAVLPLDLNGSPFNGGVTPGTVLNFQFWYRDGGGATGANLSDALRVRFCN